MGLGQISPAPGTVATALLGMPLAWAIGQLPEIGWRLLAILALNLVGVPLTTIAGRALGGQKDNQAIVWDEIVTVPVVFLLVPLGNWPVAIVGFLLHRLMDITKPPPARQVEQLPDGLGVMADDMVAGIYACLALAAIAWFADWRGWATLAVVVG
jgi:phosphatidylglycerophosphatase A